jgi:hypothetical protein
MRIAQSQARAPFDVTNGPLMRAQLLRLGEDDHVLLLNIHHIVADGWSLVVLVREVAAIFEAFAAGRRSPLDELAVQYADWAVWQHRWLASDAPSRQIAQWRQRLADAPLPLELPSLHPRTASPVARGAIVSTSIGADLTAQIDALARDEGATLFSVLLAAYNAMLHSYSGDIDLVVGSPAANRGQAETEGLIGVFFNALALRADLSGDPSFRALVRRAWLTALEAFANEALPFDTVARSLRDANNRTAPLFRVWFVLQVAGIDDLRLPGLSWSLIPLSTGTSRFDISLSLTRQRGGLTADLEYNMDLFDQRQASEMLARFVHIVTTAVADPDATISAITSRTSGEFGDVPPEAQFNF